MAPGGSLPAGGSAFGQPTNGTTASFWSSKLGIAVAAGAAVGGCALIYYVANRQSTTPPESKNLTPPSESVDEPAGSKPTIAEKQPTHAENSGGGRSAKFKSEGNDFYKQKKWEDALRLYTEGIAANDDASMVAQCFCNRAAVYIHLKQFDKAIADCDSALGSDSQYFRAYKRRADALEAKGDLKACIRDLFKAINSCDPAVQKSTGLRGGKQQHELAMRDFDRALADLGMHEANIELDRRTPMLPAKCLIETFLEGYGSYLETESEAIDTLTEQIESAEGGSAGHLYYRRALAKITKKKYATVLEDASTAVKILREAGGDDSSALVNALSLEGDWFLFSGLPKKAGSILDEALALQSDHVMSMIRRALVHGQMQDPTEALKILEAAQKVEPTNGAVTYFLAQMMPRAAASQLSTNSANPVDPRDPRMIGAIVEAEKYYNECLKHDFKTPMVYVNLAALQYQQNKALAARKNMEIAEKEWPKNALVLIFKGQHLLQGENNTESMQCWDRAAELDPQSPLPDLQKAHVYLQQGSTLTQGLACLRNCIKKDAKFDPAHQLLGQLSMQSQDWKTALTHFNEAIKYAREMRDLSLAFGFKEVCTMRLEQSV